MKKSKILVGLLFLAFTVFALINVSQISAALQTSFTKYFRTSPCDQPIHYKIGTIDKQFGLSESAVLTDTKQASAIWEKVAGKQLFIYDNSATATLTINFVYDQRTALNKQVTDLESTVKQKDSSLQAKIADYKQKSVEFEKELADFKAQVAALNEQIRYWNERGGAPEGEYQKLTERQTALKQQQASLQAKADSLNKTAKELNLSAQDYNTDVSTLNTTIHTLDAALVEKPEEGLYDGGSNTIYIYFATNHNEVVHTLAHELGHALGLPHNTNLESIMFASTSKTLAPTNEDIAALNTVCSTRYIKLPFTKSQAIQ